MEHKYYTILFRQAEQEWFRNGDQHSENVKDISIDNG